MLNGKMQAKFLLIAPLLLASLLFAPFVRGQAVANASVTGRVVDSSGASIPNATVKITGTDTGASHTIRSNQDGLYTIPNLPIGPYKLDVTSAGFETYAQSGIVLRVGDNVEINVTLTVGSASETVQVEANASMVSTQVNNVSQVIDEKRIVELPLDGRDPTQLITLSGAAVNHTDGTNTGAKSFLTAQSIAVGGAAGDQTNYLLDGGDNNDSFTNVNLPFPFPDALQEFSVESNSLPARNGLHPGGLVNAVTKSGSNQWHGDLFEFVRNYRWNAVNYFSGLQDSLKRNQFGGTFGGRVIRDKLFFFGGYQGSLIRQNPSDSSAFIPTQAALNGDFSTLDGPSCQSSGTAKTIKDPASGAVLANDYFNPARFDQAAVKLAAYLPIASATPCGKVYWGTPVSSNEQQYISRVDWTISSKQNLFGRYLYDNYDLLAFWDPKDILITATPGNYQRVQSQVIGDNYTFTSNLLNSFHFTFSRRRIDRSPSAKDINAASLGVQNIYQGTPNYLQLSVTNGFNIGSGSTALAVFNVNTFQEADDVDWLHGKHQISFGVDFIRTQDNVNSHYEDDGTFSFSNIYSGDPMLDYLSGYMNKYEQTMPQQIAYRQTVPGLYIQDAFHATPKLVINAGVRWEPLLYPQDYFNRGAEYIPGNFTSGTKSQIFTNAPAGLLFYGDKGVPRGFTQDQKWHFSPRLGIVYNPDGLGKTTLRAGGAYQFDTLGTYLTYRVAANNLPFGITDTLSSGPYQFSSPWTNVPGGNPFPLPFNPPKNLTFPLAAAYVVLPQQFRQVGMAQWSAGIQHQFSANWAASATYLGNSTSHMMIANEINPAVYIPGNWTGAGSCGALTISPGTGKACASTGNTQNRRANNLANPSAGQYYGAITLGQTGMSANYNGMLATLEHRFSQNYTVLANYTWSKCMMVQPINSLGVEGAIQNPYNPRSDYGPCTYDSTNLVNLTGVVASAFKLDNKLVKTIVNGWQLAPLMRYETGLPFSPLTGVDNSLTGIGVDRPNLTGKTQYTGAGHTAKLYQYLNATASTTAYVANPLGTFGNAGHDSLRGPRYVDVDAALSRMFPIHESLDFNLRFEAFNLMNHPNFANPNATLSSSSFGQITTILGAPRVLQFAAKLTF